ncbi:hypothetical protein [Adonisia turfae]|uniref:hypothetical protein n=1 Tax=Adonisia turfae TaxID=2950184 RepID=UPI0013D71D79|nr:hypothetical protein [Adonisia turfae]
MKAPLHSLDTTIELLCHYTLDISRFHQEKSLLGLLHRERRTRHRILCNHNCANELDDGRTLGTLYRLSRSHP